MLKKKVFNVKNEFKLKPLIKPNQINLKNKIINNLTQSGKKRTCEKMLIQFFKKFQKDAFKNYKNIVKLAIKNATPIFLIKKVRIGKKRKRKEINFPFIPKEKIRISISIKNIVLEILKKKDFVTKSYKNLAAEFWLTAKKRGEPLKKKVEIQEETLKLKKKLTRFRWF
jgi:ribosomal protein S7